MSYVDLLSFRTVMLRASSFVLCLGILSCPLSLQATRGGVIVSINSEGDGIPAERAVSRAVRPIRMPSTPVDRMLDSLRKASVSLVGTHRSCLDTSSAKELLNSLIRVMEARVNKGSWRQFIHDSKAILSLCQSEFESQHSSQLTAWKNFAELTLKEDGEIPSVPKRNTLPASQPVKAHLPISPGLAAQLSLSKAKALHVWKKKPSCSSKK